MAHRLFADGASSGNPGPGGWGCVLRLASGSVVELGGADPDTTNNRMELMAVIEGLVFLGSQPAEAVQVCTDSRYLIDGITKWIAGWRRKGWVTASGDPVRNQDLWERLDSLVRGKRVEWIHVRGHQGVPGNERADAIAAGNAKGLDLELYAGPLGEYGHDLDVLSTPGAASASARRSRKGGKALAYLSLVGGEWKRHATWPECERRVKGVSGARFQKVFSEAEIAQVLRSWGI